jgi:hypothetical protein
MFFRKKKMESKIPGFVYLTSVSGGPEVDIVKSLLESYGIPVNISYEAMRTVMGLTMDGMGNVDIFVPADKRDEAEKILNEQKED